MIKLKFLFFKKFQGVNIHTALRVSIWLEENDAYLMPCEFKEILKENNHYKIKVNVLDPDKIMSEKDLNRRFYFGHPGKVIGYGILKEIIKNYGI